MINELQNNKWIDLQTRLVALDFTIYNGNINLFSQIRYEKYIFNKGIKIYLFLILLFQNNLFSFLLISLIIEFPATGGMLTSWSFESSKLIRFITTFDYVIFAFEIIFALFILYYTVEEVLDVKFKN